MLLGAAAPTRSALGDESVAVLPLSSPVLSPPTLRALNDVLVVTVDELSDLDVISPGDVDSILGVEAVKDALGCDNVRCAADLGMALGCRYVLSGSVTKLGGELLITLTLMDGQAVRPQSRAQARVPDDEAQYEHAVVRAARSLFGLEDDAAKADADAGAPPSVEASLLAALADGLKQPNALGTLLPVDVRATRKALLDSVVADPRRYAGDFIRARLGDHPEAEQVEVLFRLAQASSPGLKQLLAAVTPIVLATAWPKGKEDATVAVRFLDEVEREAAGVGLTISRSGTSAKDGWRLTQELVVLNQGAVMGTQMLATSVGGNFRLLSGAGALKDAFDNRATAVHVAPDRAAIQATERLAKAAVTRLLQRLLAEATASAS